MYTEKITQIILNIKNIQLELSNKNAKNPTNFIQISAHNDLSNDLENIINSLEFLSKTLLYFFTPKNQKNNSLQNKVNILFDKIEKTSISSSKFNNIFLCQEIYNLCKEIIFIHEISNIRDIRDLGSDIKKDIKSLNLNHIYKCYCPNILLVYASKSCTHETIQAHSISKSNNFTQNNYYSFYSNILDKYILSKVKFHNISKDKASTSHTFCNYHDSHIFASKIEGDYNISITNENHYFLQNMRIFYKRETEDLEKHFLKIKIYQKFPSVFDDELLSYNQDIDSFDKLHILEHKVFQNKEQSPGTLYFSIELNPENPVKYLSSTCGDGYYLDQKTKPKNTYVFFHILQNKNNPCIIFSTFNTYYNKKLLKNIKKLYQENKENFWNLVVSFSCLHENTFFTEDFIKNNKLSKKFLEYAQKDNEWMFIDTSSEKARPFFKEKIKLTADEINFLFQVKDTHTNL